LLSDLPPLLGILKFYTTASIMVVGAVLGWTV
jgi:hypothetical protein